MEYKWSVNKVHVVQQEEVIEHHQVTQEARANVVTYVEWLLQAQYGANKIAIGGSTDLVAGEEFVEFDQLTEQQMLDWCFETDPSMKDTYEAQVLAYFASQSDQKVSSPSLPWVTAA
jgi:hypothetical protein